MVTMIEKYKNLFFGFLRLLLLLPGRTCRQLTRSRNLPEIAKGRNLDKCRNIETKSWLVCRQVALHQRGGWCGATYSIQVRWRHLRAPPCTCVPTWLLLAPSAHARHNHIPFLCLWWIFVEIVHSVSGIRICKLVQAKFGISFTPSSWFFRYMVRLNLSPWLAVWTCRI